MRILWTKKAEKNLSKILSHLIKNFSFEVAEKNFHEIQFLVSKLSDFPNMGRMIGGNYEKRQLIVSENTIIYEIILGPDSYILIRNVRPRRTRPT
jgi:plasmid stabilization system protein ParE